MRISRSSAARATLIAFAAISLAGCVTTDSSLTVRSSYGGIAQRLGSLRPAVPQCPPGTQLQLRSRANTEIWVDTALQLGDKSLRTMERLVRAQLKRQGGDGEAVAGTRAG